MQHRFVLIAAAALLTGLAVPAQRNAEMVARRDAKLAEAWVDQAPWVTDYDKARSLSKQTGKPIFAYFTRSYAA